MHAFGSRSARTKKPRKVSPGVLDRGGLDVRGIKFDALVRLLERGSNGYGSSPSSRPSNGRSRRTTNRHSKRHTEGTASAAQIKNNGAGAHPTRRPTHEEFRAPTRHENTGTHFDSQTTEFDPTKDVLKRKAGNSPSDHILEFDRRCIRFD